MPRVAKGRPTKQYAQLTEWGRRLVAANMAVGYFHAGRIKASAKRMRRLDDDAFESAVGVGMTKSASTWNPSVCEFSTWCHLQIRQEMNRSLRESCLIAPPFSFASNTRKERSESEEANLKAVTGARRIARFDHPASPESSVVDVACRGEMGERVFSVLRDREAVIVREIYWNGRDLKKVAVILGISYQRVQQLHQKVIARLRKLIADD